MTLPVIARTRSRRLAVVAAVGWAVLAVLPATAGAPSGADTPFAVPPRPTAIVAADGLSPNLLDRRIGDVAALPTEIAGSSAPRLLTVATGDAAAGPGGVVVTILERADGSWSEVVAGRILTDLTAVGTPWLVGPIGDRFVLVAPAANRRQTALVRFQASPDGVRAIASRVVDGPIRGAAAADTDGNGDRELVVLLPDEGGGAASSCDSSLAILDPVTLKERERIDLPGLGLLGAAVGELDGRPGADLAGYAAGLCGSQDGQDQSARLLAIRLADGAEIGRALPLDPDAASLAGPPSLVDHDLDGIDEVVRGGADGVELLQPRTGRRWTVSVGTLLGAATVDGSTRLAIAAAQGPAIGGVTAFDLTADADGAPVLTELGALEWRELGPARTAAALSAVEQARRLGLPTAAWWGDLTGEGCPELITPLLRTGCPDASGASVRPGPAWIGTTPLVAYGVGDDRRLLVASSTGWAPGAGGLDPPTPAAAGSTWRTAQGGTFELAELSTTDLAYFRRYPVPSPTVDRRVARDPITTVSTLSGVRLIVRIVAVHPEAPDPAAPVRRAVLDGATSPGEDVEMFRIGVPVGSASGIENSTIRVGLDGAIAPDGLIRPRWLVTILGLNDWGEMSEPVRQSVTTDVSGPSLAVDAQFLTAPWPFAAPLRGRTEPGVRVSIDGGPSVEAGRGGRFEFRRSLAPWPQTIEFTATDPVGNVTVRQVTFIGGLDYRQLPWEAILAVGILALVTISTLRAGRRRSLVNLVGPAMGPSLALAGQARGQLALRRDVAWGSDDPDLLPLPEIEDLP